VFFSSVIIIRKRILPYVILLLFLFGYVLITHVAVTTRAVQIKD